MLYYSNDLSLKILLNKTIHFKLSSMCIIGTSGDTGSAAIEAVKGKKWIDIIVLYPKVCNDHN